jgi:hypothetical protein
MPRSRKPRRAYRPQPTFVNSIDRAIVGSALIEPRLLAMQSRVQRAALTGLLRGGRGADTLAHWRSLADAANMAEQLERMGLGSGPQAVGVIQAGQHALASVWQRQAAGGSWTLHASEADALRWLVQLHDVQLAACSHAEFEAAFQATRRRVEQAQKGNAPPGAIVLGGDIGDEQRSTRT